MTRTDDELGTVRYCARCAEWWPDDDDFWLPDHDDCIACTDEMIAARRAKHWERVQRYRARRKAVTA